MIFVALLSDIKSCDYTFESSNIPYISHQEFIPGSTVCIEAKNEQTAVVFNNWERVPAKVILDNGTIYSITADSPTTGVFFGKHKGLIKLFLPLYYTSLSFGIFAFPNTCQKMYVTNHKKDSIFLKEHCGIEGCTGAPSSTCLFSAAVGSVKYSINVNTDNSKNNLTIYYSGKEDSFSGDLSSEIDLPEDSQVYLSWFSDVNNPTKYAKLTIHAPSQQATYQVGKLLGDNEFRFLIGTIQSQYSTTNVIVLTLGAITLVAICSIGLYIIFGGRPNNFCGYHCVKSTNTMPDGGVEERPIQIATIEPTVDIENEENQQNNENDPYRECIPDEENPYAA